MPPLGPTCGGDRSRATWRLFKNRNLPETPGVGNPVRQEGNFHFGFRGLAILASALRCRMNAAFRTRPERRIYAAGPQNENG
jgi:hypothetical protein